MQAAVEAALMLKKRLQLHRVQLIHIRLELGHLQVQQEGILFFLVQEL